MANSEATLTGLSRTVKGVHFPYPLMIAGGVVKEVGSLLRFAPTEIIPDWGSIETVASPGNGGRDYYASYGPDERLRYGLNCLGIPNPGMDYVEEHARETIKLYEGYGKPLACNVSGKSPEDLVQLIARAVKCGFPVVTGNGSCPNQKGHPILCFDTDAVDYVFTRVEEELGKTDAVIFFKVSLGMPRNILAHCKKRVADSKTFTGIITGNTVPNCFDFLENGAPAIQTENGITVGGLSGPAILPIALSDIRFCAEDMPRGKIVVGCGGASNATDVRKMFSAGATLVQINTAFREAHEDPTFVQGILMGLVNKQ
ncbi:MAG TPA: hypothetical protein VJH21_01270 [Candidatus Paceibacterota bacterium]